jgi:hypothetical protein
VSSSFSAGIAAKYLENPMPQVQEAGRYTKQPSCGDREASQPPVRTPILGVNAPPCAGSRRGPTKGRWHVTNRAMARPARARQSAVAYSSSVLATAFVQALEAKAQPVEEPARALVVAREDRHDASRPSRAGVPITARGGLEGIPLSCESRRNAKPMSTSRARGA